MPNIVPDATAIAAVPNPAVAHPIPTATAKTREYATTVGQPRFCISPIIDDPDSVHPPSSASTDISPYLASMAIMIKAVQQTKTTVVIDLLTFIMPILINDKIIRIADSISLISKLKSTVNHKQRFSAEHRNKPILNPKSLN